MSAPEWRPVVGHPGYEVSSAGVIRNARTRRALTPFPNENGYQRVHTLDARGRKRNVRVHVAVLEAFVGPRPTRRHHGAHFPDTDQRNNRLENLRWALPEENEADKAVTGTQAKGGAIAPLASTKRRAIQQLVARGLSYSAIARAHGVHRKTVAKLAAA